MNIDRIITDLREEFETVPGLCLHKAGDAIWTSMVKRAVLNVAKGIHAQVPGIENRIAATIKHHDGAEPDEGEWLFDLTWYQQKKEWRISKVMLVMESEWSTRPDDRRVDFQKLLVAKAAIKLFVFQFWDDLRESLGEFGEMIAAYQGSNENEIYLFAALDLGSGNQFRFFIHGGTARSGWASMG